MRSRLKRTLAALASLALIPATAAWTVKAPHPGTITVTTYTPNGTFHGAVDLRPETGSCGAWGVETSVVGSLSWNVTIRTTGEYCYWNESGNQNEVKHVWADGYSFRVWNFVQTSASFDRTCDRCVIGKNGGTEGQVGYGTHVQYDKSGTRDTSWYSGYTTRGETVDRTETLGAF